ncbi:MAG: hypothetical protein OXF56_20265 [Rhodobacteraceae bacterium]|nr:hypothetical protein [Paracoccaceae bacterium]
MKFQDLDHRTRIEGATIFGGERAGFVNKEPDTHRKEMTVSDPDALTEVSRYGLSEMAGAWDRVSEGIDDARALRDSVERPRSNQDYPVSSAGT